MPLRNFAQFGRFLAVGLLNTLIGYSIYAALTLLGLGPSSALLLTYVIAVPLNYMTTGRLVFDTSSFAALVRFVGLYVAIYCVNLGALKLLMQQGLSQLMAQAVVVPFVAVLSFLLFKHVVFKRP